MKIQVVKKDGSLEDYDESKIFRVAKAAGLSVKQSGLVAADVTKWIAESGLTKITTLQIRSSVVENLNKFDKSAANLYLWYEGTKTDTIPR
jgi:transcriptional regulator NrdR family protein